MGYLTLSEDEVALLRFTGDLHFVAESPLYEIEATQREPDDFPRAYEALLHKGVIDGGAFRVTDEALNRLAPVTECDAVVTVLQGRASAQPEERRYCLLEEIAVRYLHRDGLHAVGADMDPAQFWGHLGRDLVPRGSGGDRVDVVLTEEEFVVLSALLGSLREQAEGVPEEGLLCSLGPPPSAPNGGAQDDLTQHLKSARLAPRSPSQESKRDGWRLALEGLLRRGTVRRRRDRLWVRPALRDLADGMAQGEQHTFVRTDFGVGDWLVRELTVVSAPGGLFALGALPGGGLRLREISRDAVTELLRRTLGPPTGTQEPSPTRPLRALLLGRSVEGPPP